MVWLCEPSSEWWGTFAYAGLRHPSEPQVYLPYKQVPEDWLIGYSPRDLVIRSTLKPEALLPAVRRIIVEADPQQPISDVQTLSQIVEEQTAPRRMQVRVLTAFALVAILLAGIGIHGLLSFTVSNRAQEIGVRIAIGAQTRDILRMVLRESAVLVGVGAKRVAFWPTWQDGCWSLFWRAYSLAIWLLMRLDWWW